MPERTIDRLEPRVGTTVKSVEGFTVEAGKVAEFAAAVGDDDPVFRDPEAAAELTACRQTGETVLLGDVTASVASEA